MSTQPDAATLREFLAAFEEVFDRDWGHTKSMLGIHDETEAEKKELEAQGLETIPMIAEDGTFLRPNVPDEVEDWGNRGRLLEAYRALKKQIPG